MPVCRNTLPEVLISGQKIAILVENRKSHSVRMRPKDLIPSSEYARRDGKMKEDLLDQEVLLGGYGGFKARIINKSLDSRLDVSPPFS